MPGNASQQPHEFCDTTVPLQALLRTLRINFKVMGTETSISCLVIPKLLMPPSRTRWSPIKNVVVPIVKVCVTVHDELRNLTIVVNISWVVMRMVNSVVMKKAEVLEDEIEDEM